MNGNEYIQPSVELINLGADIITTSSDWNTPELPINRSRSTDIDDMNQDIS